jgi:cellulose synthase operon protein C
MTSAEELLKRLESAGSIDALLRKEVPREVADMLDRCAWVRTFDVDVFEVLRKGGPDVAFGKVVASPDVRPVSGREGAYRLRRKAREAALTRLAPGGEVPPALRELSFRLAEHFRQRGRRRDELDQLIIARPSQAITLLRELFAEADACFDTPACQALLDLVHARGSLGGWQLVAEQNRLERYLVARTFWRERYRQASRFLPPRGTETAFERLLDENAPNRLQLFGAGGMGKTMHLYELIARRAVPEPRRLACALIDFDLTQLGNVLREPWLVLLEIAHQLNQQLDEPVFDDFLKQYGRERARLLLPQFAVEASVPGQLGDDSEDERERLRDAVRGEFFAVLAPPAVACRVMIVFDTLEVITHVGGANAPGANEIFVGELVTLARRLPEARIVMSGRYDLRDEIAGFEQRLGPVEHLPLHRLDADEARRYLRASRKLEVGEDVIDAAVAASGVEDVGAQPLMLAMIADVIAQDPAISADVVRQLDEPRLYYLMQRIVLRIPERPVRWLLRYGVVPRLLSRRFVSDVVVPFLQEAIRGGMPDDDPARDRKPAGSAIADAFPPVDTTADIDADDLWKQLRRYATVYSWVEPVESDVLRFHEEVVTPMRALLREQPVFAKLNQAAIDYFERRAAEDPGNRARLLQEAFYHRLVLDVDDAIADWQRRTRDMATDPEGAAALADELLDLAAREPDLLSREVVAQARVERAVANLRRATAPGAPRGSRLWDLARGDVEQASCTAAAADDARLAACRAALMVRDGAAQQALDVVAAQLARDLRPEDELIMHVRRGDALALTGVHDADADYLAAIALGRRIGLRDVDVATLHWKRTTALDGRDDLDAARGACEQGLAIAPDGTAAQAALLVLRGTLDLRVGTPSASAASTEIPFRREDRLHHEANLLLASAELARWDPDRALHIATAAVDEARSRPTDTAEAGIQLAETREIRAHAHVALGHKHRAQEDFEAAALVWDSIASDGARRCFAEIAKLQMRRVGDLQLADAALERAETVTAERAVRDLGTVRLRRAEYLARGGIGDPGALVADVIRELAEVNAPPGLRARAALEGLCLPWRGRAAAFLVTLNRALEEIQPAGARLAMLEDLDRCPPLTGLDQGELMRLRELLTAPEFRRQVDRYPERDRRVALVRLADVARITGDPAESWQLLETARALPSDPPETTFAHRQLARAAARAGHTELAEALGVPGLDERSGLAPPSPIKTTEELIDNDRLRDLAKGVATVAAVWFAWRVLNSPRVQRALLRRAPESQPARELPAAHPGPQRPAVRTEHPTLDIVLKVDRDQLLVRAWPPSSSRPREARIGGDTPVVAAVLHAAARPGPLDPHLVQLFTQRTSAATELADVLLLGQRPGDFLGNEPADLRLWPKGPALAMVPWELAAGDGENTLLGRDPRVRYLYRGCLDAEEEPVLREPGQPTVLVIRPQVRDRRNAPGMIKTTLVPIEGQYAAAGMHVFITESVDLASLTILVAEHPPDVVHIAAGFVDAGGGAAVDISSGVAGKVRLSGIDQNRLTAVGLASALAVAARARPVVVLDPPAVSHVSVRAAQLLLRNAFAAEVAAIAAVPAVIATGLVRFGCQDALYRRFPRELTAGHPVAAVTAGIRALADDTPGNADAFGFSPTALFATRPQYRIVTGP